MTYDSHTDRNVSNRIEDKHDTLATRHGRDNVYIAPIERDNGLIDIITIVSPGIGEEAMHDTVSVNIEEAPRLP